MGIGGMGRVYAAEDPRLNRKVAIKILSQESTQRPERVRRFEQEARAVSALNHPNILTIYEVGEVNGIHYIATELVEGETLRGSVGKRLGLRKVLDIAEQAASALAAAHAAGVVHRDIKPENIMLRPDGLIKILDFGLAKLTEPTTLVDENMPTAVTEPGRIMGTWMYMSPEQVRGKEVDGRTDIWSLGVVIYEMVSGRSPFTAATATDTIVSIVDREPMPLAELGMDIPEDLERILHRALCKDRDRRYQSVKDMWLDLKELSRGYELGTVTRSTRMRSVVTKIPPEKEKTTISYRWIAPLAVIVLAALGLATWKMKHPSATAPTPERQLSYSLLVQKMHSGKPYDSSFLSTGREIFENGWKFRFNFSSPQTGSLYLLNEGPGPGGAMLLTVLFPLPAVHDGVAQLTANERVETGWYVFDQHQGREKFWIVWAAQPVNEIELASRRFANDKDQGVISDPQQSTAIRSFLENHQSPSSGLTSDSTLEQSTLRGSGDTITYAAELEHR
jgi:serine/threonine protein kinase